MIEKCKEMENKNYKIECLHEYIIRTLYWEIINSCNKQSGNICTTNSQLYSMNQSSIYQQIYSI